MSEPCKFEDRIISALEDIASFKSTLESAVTETSKHIEAGSKWRVAIVCSCIGLVGLFIGAIVRFAVMDFKVSSHDIELKEIRTQLYDLNYEKGRATELSESKK